MSSMGIRIVLLKVCEDGHRDKEVKRDITYLGIAFDKTHWMMIRTITKNTSFVLVEQIPDKKKSN